MKKFEYHTEVAPSPTVERLNELGEQGWELVTHTTSAEGRHALIFKRVKPQ